MTANDAAIPVLAESAPESRADARPAPPIALYNDKVVHQFAVATVCWGIVGMAVGVLIAAQLY